MTDEALREMEQKAAALEMEARRLRKLIHAEKMRRFNAAKNSDGTVHRYYAGAGSMVARAHVHMKRNADSFVIEEDPKRKKRAA